MSKYTGVIIFIFILIVFSATVIYLYSSESSINAVMPDISDSVTSGDSDYNQAVDLLNGKNYDEAKNKAISAKNNFNQSITKLESIRDNLTSADNDVHKNYFNTVLSELELKMDATDNLLEAIGYYKNFQNNTGNSYSYQANERMNEAMEFQNVRNNLVRDNPDLFK